MVKLWFESKPLIFPSGIRKPLIRVMGAVKFRLPEGEWTLPEQAIIDTGGSFCLLPSPLWKRLDVTIHDKTVYLKGVHPSQRCRVAASLGTVCLHLIDSDGNTTEPIEVVAYLSKRAEVPLILGFADFLERYFLHCDYPKKEAFIEER